jgi:hypothetical protein
VVVRMMVRRDDPKPHNGKCAKHTNNKNGDQAEMLVLNESRHAGAPGEMPRARLGLTML